MKKSIIKDERVISEKRKIASDAFGIVYFGLITSILIQQFAFEAPFSQYAAEFILFAVAAVYIVARNIIVGNNIFGDRSSGQKMVVVNSLVSGITITAITTTLNTVRYGTDKMGGTSGIALVAFITFISGALVSYSGFKLLNIMNLKRQKQIDEKFSEEE